MHRPRPVFELFGVYSMLKSIVSIFPMSTYSNFFESTVDRPGRGWLAILDISRGHGSLIQTFAETTIYTHMHIYIYTYTYIYVHMYIYIYVFNYMESYVHRAYGRTLDISSSHASAPSLNASKTPHTHRRLS